jgi:hypothetical protein
MANITLKELNDIISKTGLPDIDQSKYNESSAYIQGQVRPYIQSKYAPQLSKLDEDKKAKVEALANVDKQMSSIFGKGGKYELMNPMATESLATGLHNIRLEDFNRTAGEMSDLQKSIEGEVGDYASMYNALLPNKGTGSASGWDMITDIFPNLRMDENGNVVFGDDAGGWVIENNDWELMPEQGGEVSSTEWVNPNKKLTGTDIIKEPIG